MLTVNYLFSTSLFLLSVEHTARPFTCRPTLHVGFFVLSAFYSVAVTGRVSSAKIKRDNVNRFSHIVSRQKLFFSWRILGKYLIMYLHIEWQRALNGSAFCTGAYLACRLDKRLFFYIRLIDILTLTILQIICKFFVQYLSFRRQTNGMNHVILRIPKGVNITSIIPSCWSDAVWRTLCSNPHSQTPKNPETAFHKRQFRDFSQFRPITRKQVKNDTIYLDI